MCRTALQIAVLLAFLLLGPGCVDEQGISREALDANNPALIGHSGISPVPPDSITITPTGMPPTATPAVAPDPILPKMDEAYKTRKLPPGFEQYNPEKPPVHE